MITRLLSFSVQAHWLIVLLTAVISAYGSYELTRLPLDALPDITNKQVMINYAAPAFAPEDVEKRITFPIESAISGLAGIVTATAK
jgi:heavy metal efflux system protein